MTAAVPDPSFRELLDRLILEHWRTPTSGCVCGQVGLGQSWTLHLATVLASAIAAGQRAAEAETLTRLADAWDENASRWYARATALASPAPATPGDA
ncbi:MAG: hypothetical protein JWM36_4885 [Hyphomicrobiales bacterium]|nr:hypothetical protein [Hyphomicrobiales bacterium]